VIYSAKATEHLPGGPAEATEMSARVKAGVYPTRGDAKLAQAALATAGIESVLVADDVGGAYPFDLTGGVQVVVDEADAENAADVLGRP
jgi:hypothetical protein